MKVVFVQQDNTKLPLTFTEKHLLHYKDRNMTKEASDFVASGSVLSRKRETLHLHSSTSPASMLSMCLLSAATAVVTSVGVCGMRQTSL